MQIKPVEHSSLYCLFADEQRREADGRETLLGWYPDGANVAMPAEGPAIMSRLLVVAVLTTPLDVHPEEIELSLMLNGSVVNSNKITREQFEEAGARGEKEPGPLRARVFRVGVQALNMVIPEPGRIWMHLTMGNLVLDSNSLKFVRPQADVKVINS